MSLSDDLRPSAEIGVCFRCCKPVRKDHGWMKRTDHGDQLEHFPQPCSHYHLRDAYNLLRRVRWGLEQGHLDIPDVCHAVEAEITAMVGR